jgi:hypothetical protein
MWVIVCPGVRERAAVDETLAVGAGQQQAQRLLAEHSDRLFRRERGAEVLSIGERSIFSSSRHQVKNCRGER